MEISSSLRPKREEREGRWALQTPGQNHRKKVGRFFFTITTLGLSKDMAEIASAVPWVMRSSCNPSSRIQRRAVTQARNVVRRCWAITAGLFSLSVSMPSRS